MPSRSPVICATAAELGHWVRDGGPQSWVVYSRALCRPFTPATTVDAVYRQGTARSSHTSSSAHTYRWAGTHGPKHRQAEAWLQRHRHSQRQAVHQHTSRHTPRVGVTHMLSSVSSQERHAKSRGDSVSPWAGCSHRTCLCAPRPTWGPSQQLRHTNTGPQTSPSSRPSPTLIPQLVFPCHLHVVCMTFLHDHLHDVCGIGLNIPALGPGGEQPADPLAPQRTSLAAWVPKRS